MCVSKQRRDRRRCTSRYQQRHAWKKKNYAARPVKACEKRSVKNTFDGLIVQRREAAIKDNGFVRHGRQVFAQQCRQYNDVKHVSGMIGFIRNIQTHICAYVSMCLCAYVCLVSNQTFEVNKFCIELNYPNSNWAQTSFNSAATPFLPT